MKRLLAFVCALMMLVASQNIIFSDKAEAAGIRSLEASKVVGMTNAALVKAYGNPNRKEPSEYGFTWHVYNKDYANFFMAGVAGGKVVALYTSAKVMNYGNKIKYNYTRAAVRKAMGSPISYVQSDNTIMVLNKRNERDYFKAGSNYVIVFYDNVAGGKVTSMLIIPQSAQNKVLMNLPALNSSLERAYERISVDLVNANRVRRGLKKLTVDVKTTKLALSRSVDMRNRNYFDHYTPAPQRLSPFDQARRMGIRFTSMGENISFGDHNAIFAHESFMNSPGHRNIVLKKTYTKIGTGVAYGSSRYVLLTNIFSR